MASFFATATVPKVKFLIQTRIDSARHIHIFFQIRQANKEVEFKLKDRPSEQDDKSGECSVLKISELKF